MSLSTDAGIRAFAVRVAERLLGARRRLVVAESCTGDWVAKACTDLPGSSRWFRGGVVAYCNELKVALLGVSPGTLAAEGAVSEAVVREMAVGALERLGGDVAVAVSGIAGPDGGAPGKPVGTVGGTPEVVAQYRAAGFTFIAIASDLGLLMRAAQAALAALRTTGSDHVHTLAGGTQTGNPPQGY